MHDFREDIFFTVVLEGGHTFEFVVQDWDTGDKPLSNEEIHDMARKLIESEVALWGTLKIGGREHEGHVLTVINPARVVAIYETREH